MGTGMERRIRADRRRRERAGRRGAGGVTASIHHSPSQRPWRGGSLVLVLQPPAGRLPVRQRREDQLQGGSNGQLQIRGGGHRIAAGMAVGRTENLQLPLTGPALSQQLLAGIKPEAPGPLGGGLPDIETGPDQPDPLGRRGRRGNPWGNRRTADPRLGSCDPGRRSPWRRTGLAQQQRAALLGLGGHQHAAQNRQGPPTDLDLPWHPAWHPGTLSRTN